tara:strand:+ start:3702 stop:4286 length:585 start_codon:yes stop_codon:yes gene_type:complete
MKNLLKLPVLLLAVILVASCGDSKKEKEEEKLSPVEQAAADGKKLAKLECDFEIALLEDDSDTSSVFSSKAEKLEEQLKKMNEELGKKWGDEEDDKIRDAFQEAYDNVWENCEEKIAEVRESLRSEASKDAEKAAKLFCEMMAALKDDPNAANNMQSDEFFKSLDEKYGPSGSASDEDKADFQKEFQAGMQDCI